MKQEYLILVDEFGYRTGTAERCECHLGVGIRHRAFVTFLRDPAHRLLVQNRHLDKLGGGRWDVSATSHVRSDEGYAEAIRRCLAHELGITRAVRPSYLLSYTYREILGSDSENEYCSLFLIPYDGPVSANADELVDHRWVPETQLSEWYLADRSSFTQWFGEAFERYLSHRRGDAA